MHPREELNKALEVIFLSMPATQVFLRHYGEDIKKFQKTSMTQLLTFLSEVLVVFGSKSKTTTPREKSPFERTPNFTGIQLSSIPSKTEFSDGPGV